MADLAEQPEQVTSEDVGGTPLDVKESALLPIILSILRYLLAAAGAWFVAKGYFSDNMVNDAIGGIMIIAPTWIGGLLTRRNNEKLKYLEQFVSNKIARRVP